MGENKKNPLDAFHEILEQQHQKAIKGVNIDLYNDILKTSKIVEENKEGANLQEIIGNLHERFRNEDLNQVTEIFIYCQSFLSGNEDPLPMPSKLCISLGKLFTNENLHYTACKVYSENEIEGGCALSFLVYLTMHKHNEPYVINFINENFEGFSRNKKTECVFQLKEILPDNEIAKRIIEDSGITEYELVFSTETDSASRPVTFQIENIGNASKANVQEPKSKLPWWKFWAKDNGI